MTTRYNAILVDSLGEGAIFKTTMSVEELVRLFKQPSESTTGVEVVTP